MGSVGIRGGGGLPGWLLEGAVWGSIAVVLGIIVVGLIQTSPGEGRHAKAQLQRLGRWLSSGFGGD